MEIIKPEQIKPGMYIKVYQKIKDKDKERKQRIEGLVITRKHGNEAGATFTVRRIIKGVGVEWTLPVFSPTLEKVELIKSTRPRRAKLYYIRRKSQKQIRKSLRKVEQPKAEIQVSSEAQVTEAK
jgi:large subunit ribosomal protein L19